MKRPEGKTLIMKGGGGSIGAAAALCCAQEGANLVLADIREEPFSAAAKAARAAGTWIMGTNVFPDRGFAHDGTAGVVGLNTAQLAAYTKILN